MTIVTDGRAHPHPHLPDEPPHRGRWHAEAMCGNGLVWLLEGPDGLVDWLWSRWQALGGAGWTRQGFTDVVVAYRRELWLWLAGEHTWAHCCSGLLGRLARRPPA